MTQVYQNVIFETRWTFRRFWAKALRHSENIQGGIFGRVFGPVYYGPPQ